MDSPITDQFPPADGFANTAAVGLPPLRALSVLQGHLDDWTAGRCHPPSFDQVVERARHDFGHLVGVGAESVAIINTVSMASGLVASSLPNGGQVLCAEEDFTSVLFPFLVDDRLDVTLVPLEELIDRIDASTTLVAVSAVQSADGRVLDLDDLARAAKAHRCRTYVDLTQAAGWLPVDASRFDVTATGAYKWLCSPRGSGYLTVAPDNDWLVARSAGWYSTVDPWTSVYGAPLRLADDARRFNVSPPWFDMAGSAEALSVLREVGVDVIHGHNLALANRLRQALGLEPSNSAIVAVESDQARKLADAGIRCSMRAGKVRFSFHLYNTIGDVDGIAEVLTS